jgi:hypothetical protein
MEACVICGAQHNSFGGLPIRFFAFSLLTLCALWLNFWVDGGFS